MSRLFVETLLAINIHTQTKDPVSRLQTTPATPRTASSLLTPNRQSATLKNLVSSSNNLFYATTVGIECTTAETGRSFIIFHKGRDSIPDSKVHVAHKGSTWILSAPGGPHVGPINLAIRGLPPCLHACITIVLGAFLCIKYQVTDNRHAQWQS